MVHRLEERFDLYSREVFSKAFLAGSVDTQSFRKKRLEIINTKWQLDYFHAADAMTLKNSRHYGGGGAPPSCVSPFLQAVRGFGARRLHCEKGSVNAVRIGAGGAMWWISERRHHVNTVSRHLRRNNRNHWCAIGPQCCQAVLH